jgi:hypothetical protein
MLADGRSLLRARAELPSTGYRAISYVVATVTTHGGQQQSQQQPKPSEHGPCTAFQVRPQNWH